MTFPSALITLQPTKSVAEQLCTLVEQVTECVRHCAVQSAAKTVTGRESSQNVVKITLAAAANKVARTVFFMV
jgi:hypothetical protein